MKKRLLIFAAMFLVLCVHTPAPGQSDRPLSEIMKDLDDVIDEVEEIRCIKIGKCPITDAILSSKTQKAATADVISQYGSNLKGRCLSGVKRLLAKALDTSWFTNTRHAFEYVSIIREHNDTFQEIPCLKEQITDYPNGTVFVFGQRKDCQSDNKTKSGAPCVYSGHIFIKISDTQEFAQERRAITKWSDRYSTCCYAFVSVNAEIPESEVQKNDDDVCWMVNDQELAPFLKRQPTNTERDCT